MSRRSYCCTNFSCIVTVFLVLLGCSVNIFIQVVSAAESITEAAEENSTILVSLDTTNSSSGNATTSTDSSSSTDVTLTTTAAPIPNAASKQSPDTISVFFVNDLLYDIFPVQPENGMPCNPAEDDNNCVGGLTRLKSYMSHNPGMWLNAGNTLGGEYFKFLKFESAIEALKLLDFNATTAGSSTFQYGAHAGLDYLNETQSVVCNIDPPVKTKSILLSMSDCNISVIGYLEKSEQEQDKFGYSLKNYTESIKEEVKNVQLSQKNASQLFTIVIGSSSIEGATAVAAIEGVNLVFFSGANFSEEAVEDKEKYWKKIDNKTTYMGSVKVNHTSVTDRFLLGEVQLLFGENCSFINASLSVANYSNFNTSDADALNITKSGFAVLQSLNETLTENARNLTGETDLCSHAECSVGNLITDGMVAALQDNSLWNENGSLLAIFPAAHLKQNTTIPKGPLTPMDLYNIVEQDSYIYSVVLTIQELKTNLERALNNPSDFLHISGLLQIGYQKNSDNYLEIISIKTTSSSSNSMELSNANLNEKAMYNISMPLSLLEIDGYKKLKEKNLTFHSVTIIDALTEYTNRASFLSLPVVGTRLVKLQLQEECNSHTGVTIIVTLVLAALFVGCCYSVWRFVFMKYRNRSDSSLPMLNLNLS